MAYGCFTERTAPPVDSEVMAALGRSREVWVRLTAFAEQVLRTRGSLRFYGKNHGWALAFRSRGRTVLAPFPDRESLTALVVLPEARVPEVCAGKLHPSTRAVIDALKPIAEGRWLFLRVTSAALAADVEFLTRVEAS